MTIKHFDVVRFHLKKGTVIEIPVTSYKVEHDPSPASEILVRYELRYATTESPRLPFMRASALAAIEVLPQQPFDEVWCDAEAYPEPTEDEMSEPEGETG